MNVPARPSPDLPRRLFTTQDVLRMVEAGDDSLSRDLGLKAAIYADHGVRDYWVVDVEARRVIIHRDPTDEG